MEKIEIGNKEARVVLIQVIDERDTEIVEKEWSIIREKTGQDLLLRAFTVRNWNIDLSPWKAPAVFGNEGFGDGAEKTLSEILKTCNDDTKKYYIGGYSLAGLFALWSACHTKVFGGVAAASPSVWFPGFTEHIRENEMNCGYVYLSLGNKEPKTRNPVMATVGDKIQEVYEILLSQNKKCILEWNEGNHFKDADLRTAKAFSGLLTSPSDLPAFS
ncbi:MAG: esterase [Lachnospiraceae bacterium]|nr:esterase [Lachnospiraceae bacterium]